MTSIFISGTGTEMGKTIVTRALALALRRRGHRVGAVKPFETGCDPISADGDALASVSNISFNYHNLYRSKHPLSPYAASLEDCVPPPPLSLICSYIDSHKDQVDWMLVEGAGGLLVPIDRDHTMADCARMLRSPLVLVAKDSIGVLSYALTTVEAAQHRSLSVVALLLNQFGRDASSELNHIILAERIAPIPVLRFPKIDPANIEQLSRAGDPLAELLIEGPHSNADKPVMS